MKIPNPRVINRARYLRKRLTPAECALWALLGKRRVVGFALRRQHPVGPYVLDFACIKARIAIEIDGRSHWIRERDDPRREEFLKREGWDVVHIADAEVQRDAGGVAAQIAELVMRRLAHKD